MIEGKGTGLHSLRARKRRYTCTKICAPYRFLCVKIIWICQCVLLFFFPVVCCLLLSSLCCHACYLAGLRWFFVLFCFYRGWFCSPAIIQISLSQSKGWFPFILLCKREKYLWTCPLGFRINYTNMISELYQQLYPYTCIIFTEEWKQVLRMILSLFLPARAINCENCQLCYQPITTENYLSKIRKLPQVFNFQHSSPVSLQP